MIIEIDLLYGWAVLERRPNHVNKWVVADIWFWQFLEPWHGRWYEYEIFIASCTDNIYDLENERWLLGDMIDHVGIYGSRVAEGLSASNVGLIVTCICPAQRNCFHAIILTYYYYCQKYTGFTLSICPSVRPSVHLWTESCPLYIFTLLAGSISYLHILSSSFRCVACNVCFKIWNFGKFFKFVTFVFFWLGIQYESIVWVTMRWRGYTQNAGVQVVLVISMIQSGYGGNISWRVSVNPSLDK